MKTKKLPEHADAGALADSLAVIDLRLLADLCETRSLASTAARLAVNVSSASRTLTRLRKLFGNDLFLRCGTQMVPTKFMLSLRERLQVVLHGLDNLTAVPLDFHPSEAQTVITIAAIDNAVAALFAPWLGRLRREAPGIEYVVKPVGADTLDDLRSGRIDLVIGQDLWAAADPKFHRLTLLTDRHVALVRAGHPLAAVLAKKAVLKEAGGAVLGLSDLRPCDVVVPTIYRPSGVNQPLRLTLALESPHALEVPYFLAGIAAVAHSDAYMLVPKRLAAVASAMGGYAALPLDFDGGSQWAPSLLWHDLTDLDPLHQWFRSKLVAFNREAITG